MAISPGQLIVGRESVQGWASGSPKDSEDTLNFCAPIGIRPMIEEFALEDAAKGYERMITNRARFRAVLVSR
jgi:propanol-preferring alcohol dehydrogenase